MANTTTLPLRVITAINGEGMEQGDVVEVAGRYMLILSPGARVGHHEGVGYAAAYTARQIGAVTRGPEDIFLPVGTLVDVHFSG